jgi:hypothetical protein
MRGNAAERYLKFDTEDFLAISDLLPVSMGWRRAAGAGRGREVGWSPLAAGAMPRQHPKRSS